MRKYTIGCEVTVTFYVDIEAETKEKALEQFDLADPDTLIRVGQIGTDIRFTGNPRII